MSSEAISFDVTRNGAMQRGAGGKNLGFDEGTPPLVYWNHRFSGKIDD